MCLATCSGSSSLAIFIAIAAVAAVPVEPPGCSAPSETEVGGTSAASDRPPCPGDLIFEDEFDTFDLERWQHENTLAGGGNWEFQYYQNNRTNSYVEEGRLHIKPTLLADDYGEDFLYSGTLDVNGGRPTDGCTNAAYYGCSRTGTPTNIVNPVKSARIRTVDSFYFKYGTVVARARLPAGDWLWPAIWLMPRFNSYGGWPASGEIDLVEGRGNKNLADRAGVNVGTRRAGSTLHWGPNYRYNRYGGTRFDKDDPTGYDGDFHEYKAVWNASGFAFSIDGDEIGSVGPPEGGFWEMGDLEKSGLDNPWKGATKMAPFDQKFYLIINLAVGGVNGFFPDGFTNPGGKPWKNSSPTALTDFWKGRSTWEPTWNRGGNSSHLVVDYVRVYAI